MLNAASSLAEQYIALNYFDQLDRGSKQPCCSGHGCYLKLLVLFAWVDCLSVVALRLAF